MKNTTIRRENFFYIDNLETLIFLFIQYKNNNYDNEKQTIYEFLIEVLYS